RRPSTSFATSSTTGPTGRRFPSPASSACLRAHERGKVTGVMTVATSELDSLVRREHSNPHSVLGAHPQDGGVVVRVLRPAACAVTAIANGGAPGIELQQIHPGGVFEGKLEGADFPVHYQLEVDYGEAGKFTIEDPYAFL